MASACASTPRQLNWTPFAELSGGPASNRALACSQQCPEVTPIAQSFALDAPVEVVAAALARLHPTLERRAESGGVHARFVAVTPTLRFRDDVDVLILPTMDGGSTMAVYSRSRVGLWDLGANRARVISLQSDLQHELSLVNAGS
jgi:uncharacterized protein (DUF1499 family)